jgi:hypothetical protein
MKKADTPREPLKKKKMADLSWTLVVNLASTNRPSTIGRRSMPA